MTTSTLELELLPTPTAERLGIARAHNGESPATDPPLRAAQPLGTPASAAAEETPLQLAVVPAEAEPVLEGPSGKAWGDPGAPAGSVRQKVRAWFAGVRRAASAAYGEVVGAARWLVAGDTQQPVFPRYGYRGRHAVQSTWYGRQTSTSEQVQALNACRLAARESSPEGDLRWPGDPQADGLAVTALPPTWVGHVAALVQVIYDYHEVCRGTGHLEREGYQFIHR